MLEDNFTSLYLNYSSVYLWVHLSHQTTAPLFERKQFSRRWTLNAGLNDVQSDILVLSRGVDPMEKDLRWCHRAETGTLSPAQWRDEHGCFYHSVISTLSIPLDSFTFFLKTCLQISPSQNSSFRKQEYGTLHQRPPQCTMTGLILLHP